MAVEVFANLANTTVTSGGTTAPAAGTTETWTASSSASVPPVSSTATPATQLHVADISANSEIILVTNISGATWTVTRGAEGTTPVAHTAGFTVYQVTPGGWLGPAASQLAAPPGDESMRVLVPMYIYPTWFAAGGGAWQVMQSAAPAVAFAVADPANGPGGSSNSDYATQIPLAKAAGVKMLGYVTTGYGTVPTATVTGQVDNWYSWYDVDGIFFDLSATAAGTAQTYYQNLYNYVKAKPTGPRTVVLNPGATPDQSYMTACDIVCDFEGIASSFTSFTPPSWESDYAANRFCRIINQMDSGITLGTVLSQLRKQRSGFTYITTNNLYNTLPAEPYWSGQLYQASNPAWYPVAGAMGDTAQTLTVGGTISASGLGVARVTSSSAVTGIVMPQGTAASQQVTVLNEGSNTVTFAAAGTSFVADGASAAISANVARTFVWNTAQTRWYRFG